LYIILSEEEKGPKAELLEFRFAELEQGDIPRKAKTSHFLVSKKRSLWSVVDLKNDFRQQNATLIICSPPCKHHKMPTTDGIGLQMTPTCFRYKQLPVLFLATLILSTCCTPVQAFASSQIMAPAATAFLTLKVPYSLLEATDTIQDVMDIIQDGKQLATSSESLLPLDPSHSLAINVADILIDVVNRIVPTNLSVKMAQVTVRVLSLGTLHLQDPFTQHPEQFLLQAILLLAAMKDFSDASGTFLATSKDLLASDYAISFATTKDWTDATFAAAGSSHSQFQFLF
jgi:hypothetical protein